MNINEYHSDVILVKIYFPDLKKRDEICIGNTGSQDKYIWQNNASRLRLVDLGKTQLSFVWELLFSDKLKKEFDITICCIT